MVQHTLNKLSANVTSSHRERKVTFALSKIV